MHYYVLFIFPVWDSLGLQTSHSPQIQLVNYHKFVHNQPLTSNQTLKIKQKQTPYGIYANIQKKKMYHNIKIKN